MNAYGLTETSSTIALLGPDDHRAAFASDDPAVRGPARRRSAARCPASRSRSATPTATPVADGERGEIWVRGEQVSGEYLGRDDDLDEGWFPTRDAGHLDDDGYLFVHGRLDDVIVRGGENLSPGEIEDVLLEHPAVAEAAVVGIPDTEWGEKVVAAVVLEPTAPTVDEDELQRARAGRACAPPGRPSASRSAPSCPSTRPASSCAASSATSSPTRPAEPRVVAAVAACSGSIAPQVSGDDLGGDEGQGADE